MIPIGGGSQFPIRRASAEPIARQRRARQQAKAERLATRRAEKTAVEQFDSGTFPILDLPVDAQGVFRTLSRRTDV
jgi:hypothetical protein